MANSTTDYEPGSLVARVLAKVEKKKKKKEGRLPKLTAVIDLLTNQSDQWMDLFAWDSFSLRLILNRPIPGFEHRPGPYPRPFRETPDLLNITYSIQKFGELDVGKDTVYDAVMAVASEASFDPAIEYHNSLKWDGIPRAETWLINIMGAEDTPLNRAIGPKWLIGAVARVREPGCLVKNIIVLESAQDFGKSSALAALAVRKEWFLDHIPDLQNKDALIQTVGKWIIEFAEFDTLGRAANSRVKAFLSTRVDTFRSPYGKTAEDHPRRWTGAATINPSNNGYLSDETGNVRFWTVECAVGWHRSQRVNLDVLETIRDQLWAEANHRYHKEEHWWLDTEPLRDDQKSRSTERVQIDAREQMVRAFLTPKVKWTTPSAVMMACHIPVERQDRATQIAFGSIVAHIGWKKYRWTNGPRGTGSYYFPPEAAIPRIYAANMATTNQSSGEPEPGLESMDPSIPI